MSCKTYFIQSIKQINPYGQEYWSARGLALLLGYIQWRNFELAIKKAMIACTETGNIVEYHFADASKPITGGKGAIQHVKDYNLSRLACYLIAQNGDPRKPEIAAAQVYFAVSPVRMKFTNSAKHKRNAWKHDSKSLKASNNLPVPRRWRE